MAKKQSVKKHKKSTANTKAPNFYKWNVSLALLHGVQGIAILILSKATTFPVTTSYLTSNTLATQAGGKPVLAPAMRHLFDVRMAWLTAVFFFMSAIAHGLLATVYRQRYEAGLRQGINRARWFEYAFSASTMLVAIGLLTGVYDLSSLIMIFTLCAVMSLLGLLMETQNLGQKTTNWLSYKVGWLAGVVPWIVFTIYLWGAKVYGSGKIPAFVYWIYVSLLVFFMSFAVNMFLQYRRQGKWANYLYGERVYMILSLVAKTALAWQIFFGALRP